MAGRATAFDRQGVLHTPERAGLSSVLCRGPRRGKVSRRGLGLLSGPADGGYLRWRADPLRITDLRARTGAKR